MQSNEVEGEYQVSKSGRQFGRMKFREYEQVSLFQEELELAMANLLNRELVLSREEMLIREYEWIVGDELNLGRGFALEVELYLEAEFVEEDEWNQEAQWLAGEELYLVVPLTARAELIGVAMSVQKRAFVPL
jgi:hypothetical protein